MKTATALATATATATATAADPAQAAVPAASHGPSVLHRLLDDETQRDPETPDGLTNHLPMALHALHDLGASDARLEAFQARYAPRFVRRVVASKPDLLADWRALRGQPDSYAALRGHFRSALVAAGSARVLAEVLPDLLTGTAAAAFHGPIRTAHALEAGHADELACALAYWAWRWQPVAVPKRADGNLAFEDWAARLEAAALDWTPEAPLISIRIAMAETSAAYQVLAGALQLAPETLPRATAWAAARYAETQSFTVLHMVTGLRAVGVLLPCAGPGAQQTHAPALVHALTAAYLAARMSAWPPRPALAEREWGDVVAAAIRSDDDHVIKLVHACVQFHGQTGELSYRAAALRAVA